MLLKPAYKLTFGAPPTDGPAPGVGSRATDGTVIDTAGNALSGGVTELVVKLDMDTPADCLVLQLGRESGFTPQRGQSVRVELGYAGGDLQPVMLGSVIGVETGLTYQRLLAHSQAARLLRSRLEKTYEDQEAGAIVRDLARLAEVEVGTVEAGSKFQAFVVDGRRSLFHHMRDLAVLCGLDMYVDNGGHLCFEQFRGGHTVHVFDYAVHVLQFERAISVPRAAQVQAWGESPGGSRAEEDWAWLTKDFGGLRGSAGSSSPTLLLERPVLRSRAAAATAASALHTIIRRRTLTGSLLVAGAPAVRLGDAVRLRNIPGSRDDETYQVRAVTHRIAKRNGFSTRIDILSKEPYD